ncbi:MAG: hypothetical protein FH756_06035 [Firmicutes bacterium]|nr:hypothetical protein [Bacillota bacterium]
MSCRNETTNQVMTAVAEIRVSVVSDEYRLQDIIAAKLDEYGIHYDKEYKLAPRSRIDFLAAGGIGIEVKKGKPYSRQVIDQLAKYTSFPEIKTVILVVERNLDIPKEINGKPCYSFGLNKLWGIAL